MRRTVRRSGGRADSGGRSESGRTTSAIEAAHRPERSDRSWTSASSISRQSSGSSSDRGTRPRIETTAPRHPHPHCPHPHRPHHRASHQHPGHRPQCPDRRDGRPAGRGHGRRRAGRPEHDSDRGRNHRHRVGPDAGSGEHRHVARSNRRTELGQPAFVGLELAGPIAHHRRGRPQAAGRRCSPRARASCRCTEPASRRQRRPVSAISTRSKVRAGTRRSPAISTCSTAGRRAATPR